MLETAGAVDNALLLAEHEVDVGQEVGLLLPLLLPPPLLPPRCPTAGGLPLLQSIQLGGRRVQGHYCLWVKNLNSNSIDVWGRQFVPSCGSS